MSMRKMKQKELFLHYIRQKQMNIEYFLEIPTSNQVSNTEDFNVRPGEKPPTYTTWLSDIPTIFRVDPLCQLTIIRE